ncbi:MAG: hypothetical protein ACK4FJ_05530 [Ferrovibrio sp.]|uniref:hypothetical protein n=1 Tax=Ferrovibrio sp. TaxID=1917215 RepID=UPI00391B538B
MAENDNIPDEVLEEEANARLFRYEVQKLVDKLGPKVSDPELRLHMIAGAQIALLSLAMPVLATPAWPNHIRS